MGGCVQVYCDDDAQLAHLMTTELVSLKVLLNCCNWRDVTWLLTLQAQSMRWQYS